VLKEADIAAGALIVTDQRRQFVDFTDPFLSLRSSALIRKPLSPSTTASSRPSPSRPRHDRRRRPSTTTSPPSRRRPARRRRLRIRTAADLLASELTYGVVSGGVVERTMSASEDPVTRALWSRVSTFWPPALVGSVAEGVQRARRRPYAFIVDSPMAAYVAGRRPCELYATEPFLARMTYALAVRPGARQLRAALDRELRRARATGRLQAMYLRWWRDECAAHDDDDDDDDDDIPATTRPAAAAIGDRHATGLAAFNDGPSCSRTASRRLCLTAVAALTLADLVQICHSFVVLNSFPILLI